MTYEQERLAREISRLLTEYEALFGDPTVICLGRARAREKLFAKNRALRESLAKPFAITPAPSYAPGAAS